MSALEQELYLLHLKKVIMNILQTIDPSNSSLNAIFPLLIIGYVILHKGRFSNWKTNELLSKKDYITHTFYYTWHNWYLILLTNCSLLFLEILYHRVDWYFSGLHIFGYGNKFIQIVEVGYTNIQSKIKINGFLI